MDAYLSPDQLCVGLYVHVDLPWSEHPFSFSSFRIRNIDQVLALQALGQPRIRYSPERSDTAPLQPPTRHPHSACTPEALEALAPRVERARQRKLERLEQLDDVHERLARCQRAFEAALRSARGLGRELRSTPLQARHSALDLVDRLAERVQVDAEVSLQLMSDAAGGDPLYDHGLNVAVMAMLLARELALADEQVRWVGLGALLHDCGWLDLPDRVVHKGQPLTRAEARLLEDHCQLGVERLRRLDLPGEVLQIVGQHHEHLDGTGYPAALDATHLAMPVRIVAVVDAYDSLCNPMCGQRPRTPHEALSTLFGRERHALDAEILSRFVRCVGVYPPGTVVELSNGALAIVVTVSESRPLKPMVLVHDPQAPQDDPIVVDLAHEQGLQVVRTLLPQALSASARERLSPRRRISCFVQGPALQAA